MFDHNIVVKLKDSTLIKGRGDFFFPSDSQIDMIDEAGKLRSVLLTDVFAVFFVKDLVGDRNRSRQQRPTLIRNMSFGKTVDAKLASGETIRGKTAGERGPKDKGMFLHPVDPKDNNQNIFINFESVVRMTEVAEPTERPTSRFPHPASRR